MSDFFFAQRKGATKKFDLKINCQTDAAWAVRITNEETRQTRLESGLTGFNRPGEIVQTLKSGPALDQLNQAAVGPSAAGCSR